MIQFVGLVPLLILLCFVDARHIDVAGLHFEGEVKEYTPPASYGTLLCFALALTLCGLWLAEQAGGDGAKVSSASGCGDRR